MAKEPKIKVEDLPKDAQELDEQALEAAVGGVKKIDALSFKMKTQLTRASDADTGEEVQLTRASDPDSGDPFI